MTTDPDDLRDRVDQDISTRINNQPGTKCETCGHDAEEHYANRCRVITNRRRCECYRTGPEDHAAARAWNAFMGRS